MRSMLQVGSYMQTADKEQYNAKQALCLIDNCMYPCNVNNYSVCFKSIINDWMKHQAPNFLT